MTEEIKIRRIKRPNVDVFYDAKSKSIRSRDGKYELKHTRRQVGYDFSKFTWEGNHLTFSTEWIPSDEGDTREVYLNGIDSPSGTFLFSTLDEFHEIISIIAACLACPYYTTKNLSEGWKRVHVSLPLENIRSLLNFKSISDDELLNINGVLT